MDRARTSSVIGMARIAPRPPSTNVQTIRARKVSVVLSCTGVAEGLGLDQHLDDDVDHAVAEEGDSSAACQSMVSKARIARITPIRKPMLGMKFVTKAKIAHSQASGTPTMVSRIHATDCHNPREGSSD